MSPAVPRCIDSPDEMKRKAREQLNAAGIALGPNKINRQFVKFQSQQPDGDMPAWLEWLANTLTTSADQKRAKRLGDRDRAKVVSYADPTGELAVNNVMAQNPCRTNEGPHRNEEAPGDHPGALRGKRTTTQQDQV